MARAREPVGGKKEKEGEGTLRAQAAAEGAHIKLLSNACARMHEL